MKRKVFFPALSSRYMNWPFFQLLMSIEDITQNFGSDEHPDFRIKTVAEVEEIHSGVINEMLQRTLDKSRVAPIVNYLTSQEDSYLNNLTIAIFGGTPERIPLDIKMSSLMEEETEWEKLEDLEGAYCAIKLNGDETLFVLDGQHRLLGLREAVKNNPDLLSQQIAVTLIIHEDTDEGRRRTRRLFTTVNRHAKPVSLGESILLDEDDASAIIVRDLLQGYGRFSKQKVIALNKSANLKNSGDEDKFSTALALYYINETLIDNKSIYPKYEGTKKNMVRVRPEESDLEKLSKQIVTFWDFFFEIFHEADQFVKSANRSVDRRKGGAFFMRPIFHMVFAELYSDVGGNVEEIRALGKFPSQITDKFWYHVLWKPYAEKMVRSKSLLKSYLRYHLGLDLSQKELRDLKQKYKQEADDQDAKLPPPLHQSNYL